MPDCARCGQPLKESAKFCGQCGAAVRQCARCGALLKEGAAFCGQCGAAAETAPDSGAGASSSAPVSYPVAAQAPGTLAYIRFTLIESNYVEFFGQNSVFGLTCTLSVDGQALRTIQMGETVDFTVTPGTHTIELAQTFNTFKIPVTRKSDIELSVGAGTQAVVVGEYSRFFGKFTLKLQ